MRTLRLELTLSDYERWKEAFDNDPVGRREHGVQAHRILRSLDDPNFVVVDLELDDGEQADSLRAALTDLWDRAGDAIGMQAGTARLFERVESKDY
ncbi:MAG TPA: hypothetical protein VK915_14380 [Gaiellaceae bacterium]|nr:hypothetical protein [Gaiellaceae bacterium]